MNRDITAFSDDGQNKSKFRHSSHIETNVQDEGQLRVQEHEPNTAISITAAQSHHGRMAKAGHDDSDGQETISEHQEEYEVASSAPGSIVDHEIKSEKVGFDEKRRFRGN